MCKDGQHTDGEECQCKVERVPNFAQPRLLLALAQKPAHGYELIELLSQEGGVAPDPGNFYRILRGLEEEGCVCSTWDTQNTGPARRVYELTAQGVEYLHTWAVTIRGIRQLLEQFSSDYETLFPRSKKRS
jgi:PadR family transcriptional regulator, regulatory protein PadR